MAFYRACGAFAEEERRRRSEGKRRRLWRFRKEACEIRSEERKEGSSVTGSVEIGRVAVFASEPSF